MTAVFVPVVDLSEHQGVVDFAKMRAAGVEGLILRVSHGRTIDAMFQTYWNGARSAGYEETDVATYTFVNPKRGIGAQCATATLDEIYRVVGHTDVGYMIDVENYRDQTPNKGTAPVYGQEFADHIREHIATAKAAGVFLFGYSNRAYWNGSVAGTDEMWVGDDALAAGIEWLAARYPAYSDAAYAKYGYPGPPDTWQEWAFTAQQAGPLPPRGGTWLGWQFSAGWNRQGPVYGATSRDLDLNIVHPDAWSRWTGRAAPTPQPQLEDDDVKIAANKTTRTMPYGDAPPASAIFAVGEFKRNIGAEEYRELYGNVPAVLLSNEALDAIPDYAPVSGVGFDQVARDMAAQAAAKADAASDAVARVGSAISDIRIGGQRIADAGGT